MFKFSARRFLPAASKVMLVSILCILTVSKLANAEPAAASGRAGISRAAPVADELKVEDDGTHAQLVFSVSQSVAADAFLLANPNRVVVDLPRILFQLDPETGMARPQRHKAANHIPSKGQGLIGSFRFGLLTQDKSRIVIDLNQPASLISAETEFDAASGKNQLVIKLEKTGLTSFLQSTETSRLKVLAEAQALEAPPAISMNKAASQQEVLAEARPVIVLDPGHGGIDSGTMAGGFIEKALVFEFAKALKRRLEAVDRYKIVLTRENDIFIPLQERVKIARDAAAALFISIHADSLPESNENVGGATVYTVSGRASDSEAARVAETENQADAIAGLDSKEDANEISGILFDLARRETRSFSYVFARTLIDYWKTAGRLNKNPQRSAGFQVLRAPDVPSVLLELGYLSNSKDSFAINSPEWRDKAAEKVTEAVENFFESHPPLSPLEGFRPISIEPPEGEPDLRKLIEGDEAPSTGHLAAGLPPKNQ